MVDPAPMPQVADAGHVPATPQPLATTRADPAGEAAPSHSIAMVVLGVLAGRHWALREAAARRAHMFWVAVGLCALAGAARRYDSLPIEKLLLAATLAWIAPLLTGTLFYVAALFTARQRFGPFIVPYLLTAPAALLYAVPVEQFLPSVEAAFTNLMLLAVVSLWRLHVEIEIMVAISGLSRLGAIARAGMVGGGVFAIVGTLSLMTAALSTMGGMRVYTTPTEDLLNAASRFAMDGGAIIAGLSLVVAIVARVVRHAPGPRPLPTIEMRDHRTANILFTAAMVAIAITLGIAGQFIRVPDLDSTASLL